MSEIAGWIAPIATMIAAIMTAANLGARITGWGFVVFAIGSVAWIGVALGSGQNNLLLTNGFLTLVNMVGIWRWLGRRAAYDDAARTAEKVSARGHSPSLFQLGGVEGRAVFDHGGATVGHVVDVMAECESGRISYLVIREGAEVALHERLHAVPWRCVRVSGEEIRLDQSISLEAMPEVEPDRWPSRPPRVEA